MTPAELTGRARTHLAPSPLPAGGASSPPLLHAAVGVPLANLARAARADGIVLEVVSGFRDFERQLAIWNAKWSGATPLLDRAGRPQSVAGLSPDERIDAILLWSALPGASRHHWGTDVDVIDRRAAGAGYRAALMRAEFEGGGPFARLDRWLEDHAARFGFFRPFRGVRSGVQPEPWHLSFAPVAEPARKGLRPDLLERTLEHADLLGRDAVLKRLEELHARYVASIDWP